MGKTSTNTEAMRRKWQRDNRVHFEQVLRHPARYGGKNSLAYRAALLWRARSGEACARSSNSEGVGTPERTERP